MSVHLVLTTSLSTPTHGNVQLKRHSGAGPQTKNNP